MTDLLSHFEAARRLPAGHELCGCCDGHGEHPIGGWGGTECYRCDASGSVSPSEAKLPYCEGSENRPPRRRHWREAGLTAGEMTYYSGTIPVSGLVPTEHPSRQEVGPDYRNYMRNLTDHIREHGIESVQPIQVHHGYAFTTRSGTRTSIIDGHHTWLAAKRLGIDRVPAHASSETGQPPPGMEVHSTRSFDQELERLKGNWKPDEDRPDRPRLRREHRAAWTPHERIFGPTYGLDHRLFSEAGELRPEVREAVLEHMDQAIRVDWQISGTDQQDTLTLYLAGSEASEWTSPELEGNNDFDVLVDIDYDAWRGYGNSDEARMTDEEITDSFNLAMRRAFNDEEWHPAFGGTWHLTGYCNGRPITEIRPYAAYDITHMRWVQKPPHLPEHSAADFPPALLAEARAVASQLRAIFKLEEPYRTSQARSLWQHIHDMRSEAFSPSGGGWSDPGNVIEKYLDQHPHNLLGKLRSIVFGKTAVLPGEDLGELHHHERPVEWVRTDALMRHREYHHGPGMTVDWQGKRYAPKHDAESWARNVESVKREGIREPIQVMWNPKEHSAYIGEGNNRLAWAAEAGHEAVPVTVNRWSYTPPNPEFKLHNKPNPVTVGHDHIIQPQPPSAIFPEHYMYRSGKTASKDKPTKTKAQVNYREGTKAKHCGNCTMIRLNPPDFGSHSCTLVKGLIEPDMVCDEWYPGGRKEAAVKRPEVLYHASPVKDIEVLNPDSQSTRDDDEGDVVFAAEDKALAAAFMVRWEDDWASVGRFDGEDWFMVISDKDKFMRADHGGAIYTLPSDSFITDPGKGLGEAEWTSGEAVVPEKEKDYSSALDAMKEAGLNVYFVEKDDFQDALDCMSKRCIRRLAEEKVGTTAAVRQVPSRDGPDGVSKSMMVAVVPPGDVLDHLQEIMKPLRHDTEPRAKMHITLLYLGETDDHPDAHLGKLADLVRQWAKTQRPFKATVQGTGTFANDGKHVLHALVDIPGGHEVHGSLRAFLRGHGISAIPQEHGFIPHITLAYSKQPIRFIPKVDKMTWPVEEIWYCRGGRWESIPLTHAVMQAEGRIQPARVSLGQSRKLVEATRKNGGHSAHVKTMRSPRGGYMVAQEEGSHIVPSHEFFGAKGPRILRDYVHSHSTAFAHPRAHLGTWHDTESGNVFLDISHNVGDERQAIEMGKSQNQIAVWDVKNSREIPTGGTGGLEKSAARDEGLLCPTCGLENTRKSATMQFAKQLAAKGKSLSDVEDL